MTNVLKIIENWADTKAESSLFNKVLTAKIILYLCGSSPLKEQYELMIEAMLEECGYVDNNEEKSQKAIEDFLDMFEVRNNGEEIQLYLKDEPIQTEDGVIDEEELGIEHILIATFKKDIFNDIIKSDQVN